MFPLSTVINSNNSTRDELIDRLRQNGDGRQSDGSAEGESRKSEARNGNSNSNSNGKGWAGIRGLSSELRKQLKEFENNVLPEIRGVAQRITLEVREQAAALDEQYGPELREIGKEVASEVRGQAAVIDKKTRPLRDEVREDVRSAMEALDERVQPKTELLKQRSLPWLAALEQFLQPWLQKYEESIRPRLEAFDESYQVFVRERIDPLLGNSHRSQLQAILNGGEIGLRPEEKTANRRLGMGLGALALALASNFVAPLMPLAIATGILASSSKYPYAYRQWKETGKIGALHLMCIYSLYRWLGGSATVGSLGAVLYGLMLKAKAVSENKSRDNLINLFQLQPETVWIRSKGVEVEIPFTQLQIGDTLVLHAGQIAPVDGMVIAGEATLDQHMLTGEAQPVEKTTGDPVLASTMVISGRLDVMVEKTSVETTAGQIAAILNRTAQNTRPQLVSAMAAADKLAIPTLTLSLASWPFIGLDGAVSLIGANSTTASYLSSSLAMLNFLNLAARQRMLIKEPPALEKLSRVDTIVFDKTGTLTVEQPSLARIHLISGARSSPWFETASWLNEAGVLMLAAAAESRQSHPIARAILAAARELGLQLPAIDHAHYEVGYGIKVRLKDSSMAQPLIRVGSSRFMTMEGVEISEEVARLTERTKVEGHSLVMVAIDDSLVGCLELQPTVRPEAMTVVRELQDRGLDLYIISGDQEAPTRKLANDLRMTGYFANTLPEAKATLVEQLQAGGRKVCFIGDGINDAIAMRQAEVSISLRGATTVATDTAHIVLMEGNLDQLPRLFDLASEFELNLKLNLRYTSGISLVALSGILLAGFTFTATEILYSLSLFGGLSIALKPLLDHRQELRATEPEPTPEPD